MTPRPLPPYGRELQAWLRADPRPWRWGCNRSKAAITIAIGPGSWEWARGWQSRRLILVVPPGKSPASFDWSNCATHDPILVVQCAEVREGELDRLARALMRDGVQRVLDVDTMAEYFAGSPDYASA